MSTSKPDVEQVQQTETGGDGALAQLQRPFVQQYVKGVLTFYLAIAVGFSVIVVLLGIMGGPHMIDVDTLPSLASSQFTDMWLADVAILLSDFAAMFSVAIAAVVAMHAHRVLSPSAARPAAAVGAGLGTFIVFVLTAIVADTQVDEAGYFGLDGSIQTVGFDVGLQFGTLVQNAFAFAIGSVIVVLISSYAIRQFQGLDQSDRAQQQ